MAAHSAYHDRITGVVEDYRAARAAFDPPADPPDADRAMTYCREGLGPTVMVYVDARTTGDDVRFSRREFDLLHEALNGYLSLYAACHGVAADPDVAVRTAAQLLLDTHNVRDVAAVLTGVDATADAGGG